MKPGYIIKWKTILKVYLQVTSIGYERLNVNRVTRNQYFLAFSSTPCISRTCPSCCCDAMKQCTMCLEIKWTKRCQLMAPSHLRIDSQSLTRQPAGYHRYTHANYSTWVRISYDVWKIARVIFSEYKYVCSSKAGYEYLCIFGKFKITRECVHGANIIFGYHDIYYDVMI